MEKSPKYKIYFYSNPYFLVLDNAEIIDINLDTTKKGKFIEINYLDNFFDFNLEYSRTKEWSLIVQTFDNSDKFISQIDVYGENLKFKRKKKTKTIQLEYDQITNNRGWLSIPKVFEEAEKNYQNSRKTYIRDLTIKKILD